MVSVRRMLVLVVVVSLFVAMVSGCAAPAQKPAESPKPAQEAPKQAPQAEAPKPAEAPKVPEVVRIGAAAMGGNYFVAAGGLATVLNKQANMQTSVLVTGGGRNNAILANDGKIDLGFTNTVEAFEEWTKNNRQNMRSVFPAFSGELHFVVMADKPVTSVKDVSNLTVSLGASGSTHNVAGRLLFEALGVQPKKIINANLEDTINLMKDGQCDAMFTFSSPPVSSISELATTHNIKLISLTDEEIRVAAEKVPAFSFKEIPANSYRGQSQAVKTISSWNIVVTNKDSSPEFIKTVLETVYKNKAALVATMKSYEGVDYKNVGALGIPLHAAAVKYYKDNGVDVPQKLLPPEYKP